MRLTEDEKKALEKWLEGDRKAQTRIILGLSDPEMVNISGATTASKMWQQLSTVKEARG
jgi:hypothetical protein